MKRQVCSESRLRTKKASDKLLSVEEEDDLTFYQNVLSAVVWSTENGWS